MLKSERKQVILETVIKEKFVSLEEAAKKREEEEIWMNCKASISCDEFTEEPKVFVFCKKRRVIRKNLSKAFKKRQLLPRWQQA